VGGSGVPVVERRLLGDGSAGAGCHLLPLDVTDEQSMRAAVDTVVARDGTVGALINNAGYSQSGAVETLAPADLRRQFETNVVGLVRMCQLVLPAMRERGRGRIVNVSSMGGNFTFPGAGAYHASKYAVEALSDALRFEVAGFGVDVVIIQPGLIRTGFAGAATAAIPQSDGPYATFNAQVAQTTEDAYRRGPLSRLGGTPEDVARAIEKVLTTARPPIRVRVTPSARLLIGQRRLLGDRMWDRFLATQFRHPRTSPADETP
jgi:NAD(P)-dependent dehydrogenase (short-subunit alcohol dehydrogenase family)